MRAAFWPDGRYSGFGLSRGFDTRCRQLDRVVHADLLVTAHDHAAVVNQAGLLQRLQYVSHRLLTAVVVQHFLAQPLRMRMQQAGKDFCFQCIVAHRGPHLACLA